MLSVLFKEDVKPPIVIITGIFSVRSTRVFGSVLSEDRSQQIWNHWVWVEHLGRQFMKILMNQLLLDNFTQLRLIELVGGSSLHYLASDTWQSRLHPKHRRHFWFRFQHVLIFLLAQFCWNIIIPIKLHANRNEWKMIWAVVWDQSAPVVVLLTVCV